MFKLQSTVQKKMVAVHFTPIAFYSIVYPRLEVYRTLLGVFMSSFRVFMC